MTYSDPYINTYEHLLLNVPLSDQLWSIIPTTDQLYHFIIHQIFSLARDWSKRVTWANIPQLKLGNIPQFLNPMDNKHNSLSLAAKICSDICPWTLSVPRSSQFSSSCRAPLSENCSLLGTDNVRGQISEHIFASNEGYCLYSCHR